MNVSMSMALKLSHGYGHVIETCRFVHSLKLASNSLISLAFDKNNHYCFPPPKKIHRSGSPVFITTTIGQGWKGYSSALSDYAWCQPCTVTSPAPMHQSECLVDLRTPSSVTRTFSHCNRNTIIQPNVLNSSSNREVKLTTCCNQSLSSQGRP